MSPAENAIAPTREDDFPEWYQQVVRAADLAENSAVRGCMVIRPWGYGIWENLQRELDDRIKATGHENAYFPLLIPLSYLEKEATHVDGFAKECAVVTHHRLELKAGKLVPTGELEEPLIIRPTSETIIGESFSKWIQSYRDLPVLINQWANVFRWEMRTRLFLRTAEFLWQEGHTAHATEQEALEETDKMLSVYQDTIENVLAIPVITGEKIESERFPGAVKTLCVEAMMGDRKALQAGTSHYLGQNFAKASQIQFVDESGINQFAYTTSWGASTRLIGGLIMTHGDNDGLKVPPKVAPKHVVIIPVIPKPEAGAAVREVCQKLANQIRNESYGGRKLVVHVDDRDIRGGEKNWQWIKKGVPVRIEIGPRDIEKGTAALARRDRGHKEKDFLPLQEVAGRVPLILDEIQNAYLHGAREHLKMHTAEGLVDFEEFKRFFTPRNPEKPEIHGGFVRAKWAGNKEDEQKLAELKVSVRCLPLNQSGTKGRCIVSGRESTVDAIFAKAY
jgi:prolyl-tRNA synthetase